MNARPVYFFFLLFFLLLGGCSFSLIKVNDPLTAEEHLELASAYGSQGKDELALKELKLSTGKDRKNGKAWFALGNLQLKMKDFEGAAESYRKAAALEPQNAFYRNNLAWAGMEAGKPQEAVAAAREALRLDPQRGYIYLDTLGVIQTRRGFYREAEESLLEAIATAPAGDTVTRAEALNHLIDLYGKTGSEAKAKEAVEKLKALGR